MFCSLVDDVLSFFTPIKVARCSILCVPATIAAFCLLFFWERDRPTRSFWPTLYLVTVGIIQQSVGAGHDERAEQSVLTLPSKDLGNERFGSRCGNDIRENTDACFQLR